ncbi:MAG: hypothetical protein AB3P07_03315 [Wolbachia pipientis]
MNIHPSYKFWESDLEVPINLLLDRFQDSNIRQSWLDSLSGKQLSIILTLPRKSREEVKTF